MPRITAKRTESKDKEGAVIPAYSVAANVEFGTDLQDMVKRFGETTVYKQAIAAMTVAFQGWLRAQGAAKKSPAEIQAAANAWKPGERKAGKTPQEKLKELLEGMSAEDRATILKEFKSKAA